MKMASAPLKTGDKITLSAEHLDLLIQALRKREYHVIGPTVRGDAIVYDELASARDLPSGWSDEQDAGVYRLKRRPDGALFGYATGPHSWKKFLYPPEQRLYRAVRDGKKIEFIPETPNSIQYAFLGARACELNAIAIQDKVFRGNHCADPIYHSRREKVFMVAVNCIQAGGTCFCASLKTGPKAATGFDLALTEVLEDGPHHFVVEIGTERGAEIASEVPHQRATDKDEQAAARVVAETARHMGRRVDTRGLKEALYQGYEHPRWEDVAKRCLTCGNCTLVCPTCFCTTVEDSVDLPGAQAERRRKWDSCFTLDFSYIAGGSVRATPLARYRQWLTHKFATWTDQFGSPGCVGCGRCITWCPAGIDLTEEIRALRNGEAGRIHNPIPKEIAS